MDYIETRDGLIAFQQKYKMRDNWDEPDEQGIDAVVAPGLLSTEGSDPRDEFELIIERGTLGYEEGNSFDFTATVKAKNDLVEAAVFLLHEGNPVACINLANLFAFACGYEGYI
jgi:hypothetical protein